MNPPAHRVQARAKSARCPRCGSAFDCGMYAQPFACWCQSMPGMPAERLQPGGRCLCPECLAAEIARVQVGGAAGGEGG